MYRDKGKLTKTSHILLYMLAAGDLAYRAKLMGKLQYSLYPEYRSHLANRRLETKLRQMYKRGWIQIEYIESKRIAKLTRKGELEALFQKARLSDGAKKWDGKWRMVIFDIPENARMIRDRLRKLLKGFGFKALQASVYVHPFALNAASVEFLKQSGFMRYIRLARVDSLDDDADLQRDFRVLLHQTHGRNKGEAR